MDIDSEKLRKYLLGDLPLEDAEAIEERVILDEEFEEDIINAENSLVEDHLDGVLTADEDLQFKNNYLVTSERRKNVAFVAVLRGYSDLKVRDRSVVEIKDRLSFFKQLKEWFSSRPLRVYAAGLLLLVCVGTASYFWLRHDGGSGEFQDQYAVLNAKNFSDLEQYKNFPNIDVLPGNLRGTGSAVRISATPPGDTLFVRLALPVEFKGNASYDVRLIKENKTLLRFELLHTYQRGSGEELRLLLPLKMLEKGRYNLEATVPNTPDSSITYGFIVE